MKKEIIVLMAGSLLATTGWTAPAHAAGKKEKPATTQESAKEESIGLGSGAAIGAIAGGPVGLIFGAAFGALIGDRFHHVKNERAASDQRADQAEKRAASAEGRLSGTEQKLASTEAQLWNERVAHREDLEQALAVEVLFRTEESAIDGATEQRLTELAHVVEPMDGAVIRLEGFTDARGTTKYNEELSTARAATVRDALMRAGMPAERIVVTAAGESEATASEQDADGMALERRVQIKVVGLDDASKVAQTVQ